MSTETDDLKAKIASQFDREAKQRNNAEWLEEGKTARIPESPSAHYFIERKINQAMAMYGDDYRRSNKALEIGCSFGHMTSLLACKFDHLTAVDLSLESINIAEKRLKRYNIHNVEFKADDAEELSTIEDEKFDVIFSFSTLRYCPNPDDALNAIMQKLKPGGTAIVDFPNRYSLHTVLSYFFSKPRPVFDKLYSRSKTRKLFETAGFEQVEAQHFMLSAKHLPSVFLPAFKFADELLEIMPALSRFLGYIMVKGVKPKE
jgi:ubiquinone/menaquinone biosynthesis C-methylase UbiE